MPFKWQAMLLLERENHFVGTKACPNTKKDDERPNTADTNTPKKKNYASGVAKRIVTIRRLSENHQNGWKSKSMVLLATYSLIQVVNIQ